MNREILKIALPAIVANITVPLLGLVDTAIAGHLGNKVFIGAVAVGAMMFNLVYWNFGFLRMSTSGMTAQTCGSGDFQESAKLLGESTALAALAMAHPPAVAVDYRSLARGHLTGHHLFHHLHLGRAAGAGDDGVQGLAAGNAGLPERDVDFHHDQCV